MRIHIRSWSHVRCEIRLFGWLSSFALPSWRMQIMINAIPQPLACAPASPPSPKNCFSLPPLFSQASSSHQHKKHSKIVSEVVYISSLIYHRLQSKSSPIILLLVLIPTHICKGPFPQTITLPNHTNKTLAFLSFLYPQNIQRGSNIFSEPHRQHGQTCVIKGK